MISSTTQNPKRVVVIGASAGGVEALSALVAGLPANFPAPVLIAHHQAPDTRSMMPAILTRAGQITARHAVNNEPIEPGTIYIAPPDRHMLIRRDIIVLGHGARENGTRPAIDPLFRTAARYYGSGVIGVVLTGNLDDGTVGAGIIKNCGGLAIVQDPEDASYPSMPENAILNVAVDYVAPITQIPELLKTLIASPHPDGSNNMNKCNEGSESPDPAEGIPASGETPDDQGSPSVFTCPDCHGTLWEIEQATGLMTFRCRVGHAYSPTTLASQQAMKVEEAMWIALRALEERANLLGRLSRRAMTQNHANSAQRFALQKQELEGQADILREILVRGRMEAENAS